MCSASISGKGANMPFWKGIFFAFPESPKNTIFVMNHNETLAFVPFREGCFSVFLQRQKSSLPGKAKKQPSRKGTKNAFPERTRKKEYLEKKIFLKKF